MDVDRYLEKRKLALSKETLKVHSSVLSTFEVVTGCFDREPTLNDVEEFILRAMDEEFMLGIGRKPVKKTTLSYYLTVVKQYFRAMRLEGLEEFHDLMLVMKPRVRQEDYRRAVLTEEEVRELLKVAEEPYGLAFALGYCCCRRLSEVLMLKGGDVHKTHITFNILKKKDRVVRDLPVTLLPERWREELFRVKKKVGSEGRVIDRSIRAVEYAFQKYKSIAGIEKPARFHDLRHSIIVHLLDRGVSARIIKDQLSFHENVDIIYRIYGRVPAEAEFKVPAVEWV